MKKRSVILILVLVLASCSSFAQNTQSSPIPEDSATQAPASNVDASWKTYTNAETGFSIQHPANWQEQDLPDVNDGQQHRIALQGPEGGVELAWGTGFGGACPEGYQPMAIAQGSLSACHSQKEDGTDLWSFAAQTFGNTTFAGFAYTNDTTAESRAVVLQVISTLRFP